MKSELDLEDMGEQSRTLYTWTFQWRISRFEAPNRKGTFSFKFNVRGYPDGDNGKAELYLSKTTYSLNSVSTRWYD